MIEGSDGRYYLQAGAIVIPGERSCQCAWRGSASHARRVMEA